MLVLNIGAVEAWNKETELFEMIGGRLVTFEHSLWSIAQFESKWKRPFLTDQPLTGEELQDYINFMSRDGPVPLSEFTEQNILDLRDYMNEEHTAASVRTFGETHSGQFVTSDLLYATMTIAGVDWEAQYWPLSRLTMLLKIIGEMRSDKKKMSPQEIAQQNKELNDKRRRELNTKG